MYVFVFYIYILFWFWGGNIEVCLYIFVMSHVSSFAFASRRPGEESVVRRSRFLLSVLAEWVETCPALIMVAFLAP